MVRLWLVRHGQTEWNVVRRFQGWADIALTEVGEDQARELGEVLAGRRFDGVWSSDLSRAVETARLAYGEPTADQRLRELDFGELEGAVWADLDSGVQAQLDAFEGFVAPAGEPVTAFKLRVFEFLDELSTGDHLIVTHGGVIRMLTRHCGSEGFPANGEVVVLDWTNKTRVFIP